MHDQYVEISAKISVGIGDDDRYEQHCENV